MTTSAGWQSRLFPLITPHCFTFRENGKALQRWLHDREDAALVKIKKNPSRTRAICSSSCRPHVDNVAFLSLCVSLCFLVTIGTERAAAQSGLSSMAHSGGSPQISSHSAAVQPQDHLRGTEEDTSHPRPMSLLMF